MLLTDSVHCDEPHCDEPHCDEPAVTSGAPPTNEPTGCAATRAPHRTVAAGAVTCRGQH